MRSRVAFLVSVVLAGSSFGFEIIPMASTWRLNKGTSEASSPIGFWRSLGFADTNFVDRAAPFWYGDVRPGGTQLTDMQGGYTCVFLRRLFVISDPGDATALSLSAYADDGFVAWINGTEVARDRVDPANPLYTDTASTYDPDDGNVTTVYDLPSPGGGLLNLVPGTNVLAVQGFNHSLSGSSDFAFDCALDVTIVESTPPEIASVVPPPGTVPSLNATTVQFSEAVIGVHAADLRVNGYPANAVSGFGTTYTFSFTQPGEGAVAVTWDTGHGITDQATPGNAFDGTAPGATWAYTMADTVAPVVSHVHPAEGAAVALLEQIEVTFSEPVVGVDASDLLLNGSPATNLTHLSGQPYVFLFPQPATGAVSVVWSPTHGISDDAVTPNPFAGGAWSYTLDTNLPPNDLVINEILAANVDEGGLRDEDGQLQDWIEIHNKGSAPVDLANWSLSDDPALPGLWPFPARMLDPGEYLVVFASGKDRKPVSGELHTVFKLGDAGEHLGLYTPDSPRVLAGGFDPYPEQRNDVSYGVDPSGQLRYFDTPTPGAANGESTIVGVVAPLHVNVERGYFTNPFDLVVSCPTPGVTVRYTTDGSEPTVRHTVFPGTLRISDLTLFRAAGFLDDHLPSKTVTHSYLFNLPSNFRSLPILSVVTDEDHLWGPDGIFNADNYEMHGLEWERPTSVEWIEPEDNSGFQAQCGMRLAGSDYNRQISGPGDKMSFRLYFRGDYGPGRLTYPLFPLTTVDRFDGLVIRAGFNEKYNPFIRDEITRRLSHDMGQISSHGNLAVVLLNGTYFASSPYYNPCERVHEEFFQEHLGGGDEWDVVKPPWQLGGGAVDGTFNDMTALVNELRFGFNPSSSSDYLNIAQWMDLTNYVDYIILNTYCATGDWPNNNWRAGRDIRPDGIWRWCVWDAEWAMGIYGRPVDMNLFLLSGGGPSDSGMAGTAEIAYIYQGLKPNAEFRLLWADRVQKHFYNGGALTGGHITNRFQELSAELAPFFSMDTTILAWARDRRPIYFGHMEAEGLLSPVEAPVFGQHGGRVPAGFTLSMSAPAGTIFYTTDGSDPRVMFTGAESGSASAYGAPVPLNASVTVKARARQGTTWSPLTEATFAFEALGVPLRITEIMYNPVGGSIYEYVELQNTSASSVDLGGMYFEGIDFTFLEGSNLAAGARLVLGSNTDTNSWQARYPSVTPAGWFGGNLDNGGERLALYDVMGHVITSVDYNDGGGWPEGPDGDGTTLEVLAPDGDPDDPANWQESASPGGTPGLPHSTPPAQPVYLNEVMADNLSAVDHGGTFPDYVELRNPGGSPVDLGGWSLSDSGDERKFVFPQGTTLPGPGRLVVWCDAATNATPGLHAGFNLDNDGETVSLYDAGTTRIDAVTYGLQIPDHPVGRISGTWTLNTPTPGDANAAAALGTASDLALNEWMPDPVPGEDDWLEIHNRSVTHPVSLEGVYLAAGDELGQLAALSYIPPQGHARIWADHGVGPDHVDFRLPGAGEQIALYDATGALVDQLTYGLQVEGVSQGRLPDGDPYVTSFIGTASPGAANYVATYTGPVIDEVLARNTTIDTGGGATDDFVELRNPGGSSYDLGGMSLSVNKAEAGTWIFPSPTVLSGGGRLLIRCNGAAAASTVPGSYNLGTALDGESGGAYLFSPAGQLVDSVVYGLQVKDLSIGLAGGSWALLSTPTPGTANSGAAALGSNTSLVLNEWMADPAGGADWFELHNPLAQPVDLSTVSLSDDPSLVGEAKFLPMPLSFVGPGGFVKWVADANPGQGRNHVNFQLDGKGDYLLVYADNGPSFSLIDAVAFGAQTEGVSAGCMPDGNVNVETFPGSASPAASNYRLLTDVVIHEILTHTDVPLEDAIELHNPTAGAIDVGGWFLSNSGDDFTKFRIPNGVTIPAGGYVVVYEYQFNDGAPGAFALNSAHGDRIWLSKAPGGVESGDRVHADVGASFNGVSFGRLVTTDSVDYPALVQTSFGVAEPGSVAEFRTGTGAANAAPMVGPVILSEVFYNPPGGTEGSHEYVELHNNSASTVQLFDPAHPANRWKFEGGIDFTFPAGVNLEPGACLLVVDFDPVTEPAVLEAFRSRYGISPSVAIHGPYDGNLDNAGDEVALYRPDTPQGPGPDQGFVPYVLADRVAYDDASPWPGGLVDGGGHALLRRGPTLYGNEALNWTGGTPTPGVADPDGTWDTDGDGIPDAAEDAMGLDKNDKADGAEDPDGDGATNYEEWAAGTGHLDPNDYLKLIGIAVDSDAVLTFNARAEKTYSILYRNDMGDADWVKLMDIAAAASNRTEQVVDGTPAGRRFYLLVTPSAP